MVPVFRRVVARTASVTSPVPAPANRPFEKKEPGQSPQTALDLGNPPSGPVLAVPYDAKPLDELPPLPYRRKQSGAGIAIYLGIALTALVYRFAFGRPQSPTRFVEAGGLYPMNISQTGLLFSTFRIVDGAGRAFLCDFVRVQRMGFLLVLALGAIYYLSLELSAHGVLDAAATAVGSAVLPLMLVCGAVIRFYPKTFKLSDEGGSPLCEMRQRWTAFFPNVYELRGKDGAILAMLERSVPAIPRRKWRLKRGRELLLEIKEDSFANSLARRMLGHLWGLLRTDFSVLASGEPVGMIRRSRSLRSNLYPEAKLYLKPPTGLEPTLALAAALCIEIADSDRWHPWYG